ncbi:hypothetical protein [Nonomuraea sp. NPDC001699]
MKRGTTRLGARLAGAALLFTTTLTVMTAAPAHAGPADAMRRCAGGQIANHDIPHLIVWGNGGGGVPVGRDPGNIIDPGDVFQIVPDLSSRVDPDSWEGGTVGPDGNGQVAPQGWPYPGLAQYSAVLRFNNNPAGWTSDGRQATAFNRCTVFQDNAPARFSFGVNDPGPGDNRGAWTFRVLIWKASAPATGPMDRCSRNLPATGPRDRADTSLAVAGNGSFGSFPAGATPGNFLRQGDVLRLEPDYASRARMDYFFADHGPNGTDRLAAASGWPYPDLFEFSPVLRFNNNPVGWVGAPMQATAFGGCLLWTDALPVRLLFGVNDPDLSDNSGQWNFRIRIYGRD